MARTPPQLVPVRGRAALMDALRGLLASWVVLHHIALTGGFDPARYPWRVLIHHGQEPVLVFFILSGFAITRSLSGQRQHWGSFLLARAWRIYPVYCLALALGAAVCGYADRPGSMLMQHLAAQGIEPWQPDEGSPQWLHLPLHLLQLHGVLPAAWLPHADTALVAPAWSLSTEFQFYLLAPALCLLLPRQGDSLRHLPLVLAAVLLANVACLPGIAPASVLRYADLFVLGMAGAMLHGGGRRIACGYAAACLLVAIIGLASGRIIVATAVTVWLVFWWLSTTPPAARLLATRGGGWALYLGALSYPLYLIHYPLLRLGLILVIALAPANRLILLAAWIPSAIALSYLAAAALHHWVELPGTRHGKRLAAARERRLALAMPPQPGLALLRHPPADTP